MEIVKKIIIPAGKQIIVHEIFESGNFEWHLEPHAHFTLIHQQEDIHAEFASNISFKLSEGSSLNYHPIIIGGHKSEFRISAQLDTKATMTIAGAYALNNHQSCSLITRQEHYGAASTSALIINGIAADDAAVSYQGAITIHKDATKSNALQENKTMLIGSRAKAISIPSLEVQTNDVQCAHGSAVGPLQEAQVIYAQSRGLSVANARQLLITSFFAQTLQDILDENMRNKIVAQLVAKVMVHKE